MSNVETAIEILIKTFRKYSGKQGDRSTMNKAELKNLLTNEFEGLLGKVRDRAEVDRIFKDLDENRDKCVDFSEFLTLVAGLAETEEIFY